MVAKLVPLVQLASNFAASMLITPNVQLLTVGFSIFVDPITNIERWIRHLLLRFLIALPLPCLPSSLGDVFSSRMAMWKRTTGAIKDKNSLVVAYFSTKTSHTDHELETAIIKATSHDEHDFDKRNADFIFPWIQASPNTLHPLVRALSKRMEKTRSWVVAIKGLMLMHDLIHCMVPPVQKIGRLPFDLSSFSDGHSRSIKTHGLNVFIRQYFAFLDERAIVSLEEDTKNVEEGSLMNQRLLKLRKWQYLLDLLLNIKPRADNMDVRLIIKAMDCVIIEIFDVYSRICNEIAQVIAEVHSIGKIEATMALEILRKSTRQGEKLSRYFESCKACGVLKANGFNTVTNILEEDIKELEKIIYGGSHETSEDDDRKEKNHVGVVVREENDVVVERRETKGDLKTTTTTTTTTTTSTNGGGEEVGAKSDSDPTLVTIDHVAFEIPDLIQF